MHRGAGCARGMPVAKEDAEQEALFDWAEWRIGKYPDLEMMYHIPNGGKRDKVTAARLKAQGVKRGVPDICLAAPRGSWHGLYIEMKRTKGGRLEPEQSEWMEKLMRRGYAVACCQGWEKAAQVIIEYLEG